ncbi:MAG: hypothetical protein IJT73_03095 [Selenomonadaceae bacterium]|nr:hypothetical protein [Selenomonadaceae bacterium]
MKKLAESLEEFYAENGEEDAQISFEGEDDEIIYHDAECYREKSLYFKNKLELIKNDAGRIKRGNF